MEDHDLTVASPTVLSLTYDEIGQSANQVAASHILEDYHERLAQETLRRQQFDLQIFAAFLKETTGIINGDFFNDLPSWKHITFGLIETFKRWRLQKGYAIGSVNIRLATIKAYCRLAYTAKYLSVEEYTAIRDLKGYSRQQEAEHVDEKRSITRIGKKKAHWIELTPAQVELLKDAPRGSLANRDKLLICLLFDHALRVGEAARLPTSSINLQKGQLTVKRLKSHNSDPDIHELTPDTIQAAQRYLPTVPASQALLFDGLTTSALARRVKKWALSIGIKGLSPHDGRHFYTYDALAQGTDLKSLQDGGGWATIAMPARYAGRSKIANKGVKLSATRKGK